MRLDNNTILITGGGAGIGRGLAEAFHRLGNQVIISGRREQMLLDACAANPGMNHLVMDVTSPRDVAFVAEHAAELYPEINCLINNAGIQRVHDFAQDQELDEQALADEIDTNLTGLIRTTSAFLPQLQAKESATIINVSSGLSFVPLANFPVYCATKAAVHSFTQSLRYQLRDTSVKVIELAPPYVESGLHNTPRHRPGPVPPMPLAEFIEAAMAELATDAEEIAIGGAKYAMSATTSDAARTLFARMNP